ncbi:MAG: putative ubiquitin-conjugating enzyme E2 E1 [Streblomastix strix]|uniref:Putative ubiquitin-conjugating enzyme E2 E1 n=1 Tax=Streblomastix strix TaxID=222440 RepID=A0A5J4VIL3_9EUKA|nr:MAG: putative ubiquitin-conjugating enzyme E2 E1 [Streblomastix strix]
MQIKTTPIPGFTFTVNETNIAEPWDVLVIGPAGKPYAGGKFHLNVAFPPEYPFKPPTISFKTKIYHINVREPMEKICVDMLSDANWKPVQRTIEGIKAIFNLLSKPEPEHAGNDDAVKLFTENKAQYDAKALEWTKLYAK